MPIPVTFGDESFLDGVDIDAAGFYERLERSDRLPTTAQPSVAAIAAVLREALETHETAIVLPLSGHMSGTVEAARAAAREVGEDRALVVESGSVCVGLGLLALRLQDRLERGCTAAEAVAAIERLSADHRCVFSLATLEYLQRGGRIGRAQAAARLAAARAPHPPDRGGRGGPGDAGARRAPGASGHPGVPRARLRPRPAPAGGLRPRQPAGGDPAAHGDGRAVPSRGAINELVGSVGPTVGTHAGPGAFVVAFVHDPLDGDGG